MATNIKKCSNCKKAPWQCRKCGRQCCEHYCIYKKDDKTAICTKCRMVGNPAFVIGPLKRSKNEIKKLVFDFMETEIGDDIDNRLLKSLDDDKVIKMINRNIANSIAFKIKNYLKDAYPYMRCQLTAVSATTELFLFTLYFMVDQKDSPEMAGLEIRVDDSNVQVVIKEIE